MTTDTGASLQTEASPVNAWDASQRHQIVPEKLAEHTGALGEAMMELAAPAAPNEAAEVFGHRMEKVAHSLGQLYQDANSSAKSIQHVADDAFRRHFELGMHFIQDVVHVKTPAEAFTLQLNFMKAQMELFAEQWREMQRQFAAYTAPWQKSLAPDLPHK